MLNVMDLSPILNEFDTPFLVDSGTESFTESPVAEEESEHSEDSTVCDIGNIYEKARFHVDNKTYFRFFKLHSEM
jgi:hypothetical protein